MNATALSSADPVTSTMTMTPADDAPRLQAAPVSEVALALVRDVLAEYVDIADIQVTGATELAAIGVDSLTLAEMLFALEDRVGTHVPEPTEVPTRISDLVTLIEPYVDALGVQATA